MKPKFDISNKNSFTVWESGFLNPTANVGSGILVASFDAKPCQVIYDKNPVRNLHQFLFYAQPGMLIASAFIKLSPSTVSVNLELAEIVSMTTTKIQGEVSPVGEIKTIYLNLSTHPSLKDARQAIKAYESTANADDGKRNLLNLALEKALTLREDQKLFWGIPRVKEEDPTEFNSSVRYVRQSE